MGVESQMKFFRVFLLLVVPFCLVHIVHAAEYRVSTVQQINSLISTLQPGDVVIMENKVWTNATVVFEATGTESQPIILRADTPGQVFLEGTSTLRIAGRWVVVDGLVFRNGYSPSGGVIEFRRSTTLASDCRLTNTAIIDYNPASDSTDYKWVSIYGFRNRVDNCYFKGKRHLGTTLVVWLPDSTNPNFNVPNYHRIDRNYFGFRPVYPINGAETIRVGDSNTSFSNSSTIVELNYFEECNGETEAISNKSCENVYRFNTFFKTQGTLTLRHGNRCLVEGNFFLGEEVSNTGGIRIIGEDHVVVNNYLSRTRGTGFRSAISMVNGVPNSLPNQYFQVKNALVAFNTLVDNRSNFDIGTTASGATLPPLDCAIANNLVRGYTSPLLKYTTAPINMKYEGNIFFGTSLGITQPPGITTNLNPELVLSTDGLWRPAATSPVRGGAQGNYPTVIEDMDGQPRTDPKDIGADQVSSSPIVRRPLTRNDVGPLWMRTTTSVAEPAVHMPDRIVLEQNYPNPFNASTVIRFALREQSYVRLEIFGILGQRIAVLVDGDRGAGIHSVTWSTEVSSSVYFYKLTVSSATSSVTTSTRQRTMILTR
ncbi:MAG: T9SS type A sorting domain-containing protein [Ignavibacteria bacterium]|nr:T9SS type A sorting domain-containing protein [Ignavibacteria bacterium]